MTRFTDGTKTIELEMRVWNGFDYDPAFENEFFDVGGLEYDANEDAYIVEDVEYLIEQAMDWKYGRGDQYKDCLLYTSNRRSLSSATSSRCFPAYAPHVEDSKFKTTRPCPPSETMV